MSSELSASLPWDQLEQRQDDVPWSALHTFARALVEDRELIPKLIAVYDRAYEAASDQSGYTDFYVAGIFALAAPALDDERRREIGSLLIARLARAGQDDADLSLEVLTAAAGTMGPVILPAVLDAIAAEPDTRGAWIFLWSLTVLAAKTDDENLRSRVVRACVDLLERIDRGQTNPTDGTQAAWTLAALKCAEHADLLRRVSEKTKDVMWDKEYEEAVALLENRLDYVPPPELWEEPVEKWLAPQCKMANEWYARERERGDYEEEPETAEDDDLQRAKLLATSFHGSPVAAGLPVELRDSAEYIARRLVHLSLQFLDRDVYDWDESTMRELLLEILPRQISPDRQLLGKIVPVTEAFLYWLGFEGMLSDAKALAGSIRAWSDQIIAAGMNRQDWGPLKSRVMEMVESGMDLTDPEVRLAIVEQQVEDILEAMPTPEEPLADKPPIPIVEHRAKVARNAPCPCGSGKKYKKCHGRSETAMPAD